MKASIGAALTSSSYCIFNTTGSLKPHATGPAGVIKLSGACA
jgi:hypothetical protein